MYDGLSSCLGR